MDLELGHQGAGAAGAEPSRGGQLPSADRGAVGAELGVGALGLSALGQHPSAGWLDLGAGWRLLGAGLGGSRRRISADVGAVQQANPATTGLRPTAARVLGALRTYGPLTAEQLAAQLSSQGRTATRASIDRALAELMTADVAAVEAHTGRWTLRLADEHPLLESVDLHGAHDFRHTFSTWLEDAGVPARVIDELMGHQPSGGPAGIRRAPSGPTAAQRRRAGAWWCARLRRAELLRACCAKWLGTGVDATPRSLARIGVGGSGSGGP
jgi:hypothetical protein